MQVLTLSPSSLAPPPPSSYARNAPSLLDRRPSAQKLLAAEHPAMLPIPQPTPSPRTARAPFVPLTPIMASPRMTPDPGAPPGMLAVVHDAHPPPTRTQSGGDYLTRGHPTPVWTSTPPTPPSAHRLLPPRAASDGPAATTRRSSTGACPAEAAKCSRSVSPHRSASSGRRVKRRRTLPDSLVCTAPPADDMLDDLLLPSLSRPAARAPSVSSAKRRMFILGDEPSDNEDDAPAPTPGVDLAARAGEKRYHALVELLTTEVGYLLDLRALVSIYLDQLPSVTAPISTGLTRPSPSALSISSLGLSRPFPSSRTVPQADDRPAFDCSRPPEKEKEKEKEKDGRRPLFSAHDVAAVRRNARELLAWHERFVGLLEHAAGAHGFGWVFAHVSERRGRAGRDGGVRRVDEAVTAVLDVFEREMGAFEVYERFCPGHNEAADVVRTVQELHPVEWDAYELRCSLRVAHAFEAPPPESVGKRRRHSMSSLSTLTPPPPSFPAPHTAHASATSQAMRLKFLDYLIKPVQRICKYPLLLDGLRGGAGAKAAMHAVVERVNRASERETHRLRALLIASRLFFHGPVSPVSSSPPSPDGPMAPAQLSAEFVQSLGACQLGGALDVVYHAANGAVRAKYLAAFLYVGGYLILAKVPKGGKVYEAKHWFSLAGFLVLDEAADDAALPYAFHVYSASVHIRFAASCALEKDVWLLAIRDALAVSAPPWTHEPAPCFPPDARPVVSPLDEAAALPTIQSLSALEAPEDAHAPGARKNKTVGRVDGAGLRHEMAALSRRTSTSSVKAFFAPLAFESRVSRPSAQIRAQVDGGLHDVVSDALVASRSRARMNAEEPFQIRKKPVVARSNSALGAFAPRRRHESFAFASAARRKGSLDGIPDATGDAAALTRTLTGGLTMGARSKSSGAKRRLSVVPPSGAESPPAMTQSSSAASSNVNSVLPSPLETTIALPPDYAPKRTRSLVDNVRSFFHSRSLSPTPSALEAKLTLDAEPAPVRWWRRGSLRRRVQSEPEVPTDDSAPATPAASSEDGAYGELAPGRPSSRRVAFSSFAPVTRRRSLFVSSSRSEGRALAAGSDPPPSALARSKTLKGIFQFQRSNSFTPVGIDTP